MYLFIYIYVFIYLCMYLFIYLFIYVFFLNIYIYLFICLFIYLFIYLLCIYVFMYLLKYIFMSLTNYLFAYATFRKSFFLMHILFYAHLLHICVSVSVVLKFDSLEDLCELSIYGFCVKCLECCTATAKRATTKGPNPSMHRKLRERQGSGIPFPGLYNHSALLPEFDTPKVVGRDLLFPGTQVFCSVRSVWQL